MKMLFGKDSTLTCYSKMQWKCSVYVNAKENTEQMEEMGWETLKRGPLKPSTNAYSTSVSRTI